MTATVIFKTDPKLKLQAQKTVSSMGLTLTAVMNDYLRDLVKNKTVTFGDTKKKFIDPYGLFASARVSDKDIDNIKNSWMDSINKLE